MVREYDVCGMFTLGHFIYIGLTIVGIIIALKCSKNLSKMQVHVIIKRLTIILCVLEVIRIVYCIIEGSIYDVNNLLDAGIPEGDYDTISGYLQDKLGRIPEDDEEPPIIDTEKVTYKIEEYEDRRIIKIKACKNNVEEPEEDNN